MTSTKKLSNKISNISKRKIGDMDCLMKYLSIHLWCLNCSKSSNRVPKEKIKPCCHPWIYKDNWFNFHNLFNLIQDYLIVELEPPVKNENKHDHLLLEMMIFCYHLFMLAKI